MSYSALRYSSKLPPSACLRREIFDTVDSEPAQLAFFTNPYSGVALFRGTGREEFDLGV